MSAARFLRYDEIKKLAAELGRPVSTLIALAPVNDPFCITTARRAGAEWFRNNVWKLLKPSEGIHLRRLHYRLVSQRHMRIRNVAGSPSAARRRTPGPSTWCRPNTSSIGATPSR
jgi:hypothetical protein